MLFKVNKAFLMLCAHITNCAFKIIKMTINNTDVGVIKLQANGHITQLISNKFNK